MTFVKTILFAALVAVVVAQFPSGLPVDINEQAGQVGQLQNATAGVPGGDQVPEVPVGAETIPAVPEVPVAGLPVGGGEAPAAEVPAAEVPAAEAPTGEQPSRWTNAMNTVSNGLNGITGRRGRHHH